MPHLYDIVILGATPAGYAAAGYLAERSCNVVLLDAPHAAAECPLSDWVPRDALKLNALPKSLLKSCGATPFREVRYHNAALEKQVSYKSRAQAGFFLDYGELRESLRVAASEAGAAIRSSETPARIDLRDDQVRVTGQTEIIARVLIITHGSPAQALSDLSVSFRPWTSGAISVAGLDVPIPGEETLRIDGALHVVETPQRGNLGMFFSLGDTLHVRLISRSSAGVSPSQLSDLIKRAQSAKIFPENLQLETARGVVWHPPAGNALDLETHTAKRCILAGTPGGFADPITGQTIRPSIQSSLLAAEVALAGLKSKDVQEALTKFEDAWRGELSDYLRSPSTSLHLLLPLLFVNQNIVTRFTKALLYGEDI